MEEIRFCIILLPYTQINRQTQTKTINEILFYLYSGRVLCNPLCFDPSCQGTGGPCQTRYTAVPVRYNGASVTGSELHLLFNIGQRHLFNRPPPTCFISQGFIMSYFFFCSCSYVLPSSLNFIVSCFTHSIYFLADTLPYRASLSYTNSSLL